ncbi:MAG: FecR domain-containing protein, partial [Caulobacter sp.]
MSISRGTIAISVTALLTLYGGCAFAADWKLVEVNGVVRIAAPGKAPATAQANQVVPVGSVVTTAAGGRAALYNGAQRITLAPNSRMTVAPESNDGLTRVMQDLGSILFQINKKPTQHFRVETPLLAAVVKGTTFTVNVELNADSVHVAEGLVEVRANQGNAVRDVSAGATGAVMRDAPQQLNVEVPSAATDVPLPPQTAAIDYNLVSGGLIEGPIQQGATVSTSGLHAAAEAAAPAQNENPAATILALASPPPYAPTSTEASGDAVLAATVTNSAAGANAGTDGLAAGAAANGSGNGNSGGNTGVGSDNSNAG